ncbi:TPA: HAD-IB family hydrolase [Klebsiella oxytoca]|nr:HAD-IB family hydrolase [Klebsiella oxytoca]
MKTVAAFFDVDETLISIKSMFHFYKFWCEQTGLIHKYHCFNIEYAHLVSLGVSREELNKMYYRQFSGVAIEDLYQAGSEWFSTVVRQQGFYIPSSFNTLKEHQKKGHKTIFVSGSMMPLLKPLGEHLCIDNILCTKLSLDNHHNLTGEIGTPQTIGEGKREALLAYLENSDISRDDCFCYGDDLSDLPMLKSTGNPVCVGQRSKLADLARRYSWPILAI